MENTQSNTTALMQAGISLSRDEYTNTKKRFTVYKVQVHIGKDTWFIFRRYAEFDKLYNSLKKHFPQVSWRLPSKRIFGNNFDPEFIRQRRDGLNDFISAIVSNLAVLQFPDVRNFLALDNPRNRLCHDSDEGESPTNSTSNGSSGETQNINLGPSADPYAKPNDFDYLKVIGKGSFGKVLLAKHKKEGTFYAVKVLQKKSIMKRNEQKHIMAERNVLLKNLKHPFLVGLHYSFQTSDKLYFVLDYVNGGELFFHLQRERTFSEARARFYAAEIASAVGYMHSLNIIYRDLKPENILLDSEGHIVLTDFGLCKEGIQGHDTTTTFCGTPEYLAPEVLRKQPYSKAVDWWCLGAVLYEMLYGLPPFYSRDTHEMYENILYKPLRLRPTVSNSGKILLESLLQKKPEYRLGSSTRDFLDIKEHAFFSSLSWEDLVGKRIPTPYNPNVAGPEDLKHVDPEFVREPVSKSVKEAGMNDKVSASVQEADDAFIGFSYAPPAEDTFLASS
uniref:Serine/threonine-protein kinase Sgk3 n=1 Tax=Phallusia mammillata TaxID=59560 RepID=A0A6F9DRF1_9ASCI|nr:serine/threonine-protein kinase Sgk3 [Phallusia mammillata]